MKKIKKNNKGFSLVELIVVILIMAIIAVALAPQVMRWVKTSRESTDVNAVGTIISICKTEAVVAAPLAAEKEIKVSKTDGVQYKTDDGYKASGAAVADSFYKLVIDTLGADYKDYKCKSGATFTITIKTDGVVTCTASGMEYADTLDITSVGITVTP